MSSISNQDEGGMLIPTKRRPAPMMLGALALAAVSAVIGCSGGVHSTPSISADAQKVEGPSLASLGHRRKYIIGPPSSGVYIGADANPSAIPSPSSSVLEEQMEGLEGQMHRRLALHLLYRNWKAMTTLSTADPEIAGDIAYHRAPVIAWTCADDNATPSPWNPNGTPYNLVQIAGGAADSDLAAIRNSLASIKNASGQTYPVILRWFWEFNANVAAGPPNYINTGLEDARAPNGNGGCFVQPGTNTNYPYPYSTAPPLTDQFINAWNHIYEQLLGNQPVPLVTFDWNPNVANSLNGYPDAKNYFPGAATVDWIGADGYAKENGQGNPLTFTDIFSPWYSEYDNSTYGNKPLMVGETGSCSIYAPPQTTQAEYISNVESLFDNNVTPNFPTDIRALNYFDAQGQYQINNHYCDWFFNSDGLGAWEALGADQVFGPRVSGT